MLGLLAGPVAAQQSPSPVDSLVARFYTQRDHRLAWSDSGRVSREAEAVVQVLAHAADEGLDPHDYQTEAIDTAAVWRFDSLLTHACFAYAWDLSRGRIAPAAIDSQWTAAPQAIDLVGLLERELQRHSIVSLLRSLVPPQPGYAALRQALQRYRNITAQGGWPLVSPGPSLAAGRRGTRVELLRRRLVAEGYDALPLVEADSFDVGLETAVRAFQNRHGLTPDGMVGPVTLQALNVSAAARVRGISLNLERWRWLPRSLGARYLIVNSAAFTLDVVAGSHSVLAMRAIVGRPDRPTPIVSARVTELTFRPVWHVPRTIAATELLPLVQRDSGYLTREGIRVFADSAAGGRELDPATLDWTAMTESTFAYQLVQEPGPTNPLGGVKLVLWTPFDVFIHDTPARPLFTERLRAFSHGCVRVERAADLAAYLLPEWPVDSISAAMTTGRERRVRLGAPLPVHLVYFTVWTDSMGIVQFREDGYGWDERLANGLQRQPIVPIVSAGSRACGA